jgi:hypothetical protein
MSTASSPCADTRHNPGTSGMNTWVRSVSQCILGLGSRPPCVFTDGLERADAALHIWPREPSDLKRKLKRKRVIHSSPSSLHISRRVDNRARSVERPAVDPLELSDAVVRVEQEGQPNGRRVAEWRMANARRGAHGGWWWRVRRIRVAPACCDDDKCSSF